MNANPTQEIFEPQRPALAEPLGQSPATAENNRDGLARPPGTANSHQNSGPRYVGFCTGFVRRPGEPDRVPVLVTWLDVDGEMIYSTTNLTGFIWPHLVHLVVPGVYAAPPMVVIRQRGGK